MNCLIETETDHRQLLAQIDVPLVTHYIPLEIIHNVIQQCGVQEQRLRLMCPPLTEPFRVSVEQVQRRAGDIEQLLLATEREGVDSAVSSSRTVGGVGRWVLTGVSRSRPAPMC